MERTADGYAMQLPLLAPTDELPGVAGLPEVKHCIPVACPVFLPTGKEAVHIRLATLAKGQRLAAACCAQPPTGRLPLL